LACVDEFLQIKIANQDLIWTVGAPVVPRGEVCSIAESPGRSGPNLSHVEITLEGARGAGTQKFRIAMVDA
jgi:hypothetical protein